MSSQGDQQVLSDSHDTEMTAGLTFNPGGGWSLQASLGYALGVGSRFSPELALDYSQRGPMGQLALLGKLHARWSVFALYSVTLNTSFEEKTAPFRLGLFFQKLTISERVAAVGYVAKANGDGIDVLEARAGLQFSLWDKIAIGGHLHRRFDNDSNSAVFSLGASL